MAHQKSQPADWSVFLAGFPSEKTAIQYGANRTIFSEGEPANSVFYLRKGKVDLGVTSKHGKAAILAHVGPGEFFGEGCLAGQRLRIATATTMTHCKLVRIAKPLMARLLHEQHGFSELFLTHLLSRNIRSKVDLVDQLFNSTQKRLARTLLLLAHFGKESRAESVHPRINQEDLARMVGISRLRISNFMKKFKKLGYVDYTGSGGLTVRSGLLSVILHD
ncbi:MAG: Crp/Fnr family transcriptional regulator [Acidobacteriia bacterium]|nr:Crp/Fnr family transcriptional regulator [Terriglobia bacterium]